MRFLPLTSISLAFFLGFLYFPLICFVFCPFLFSFQCSFRFTSQLCFALSGLVHFPHFLSHCCFRKTLRAMCVHHVFILFILFLLVLLHRAFFKKNDTESTKTWSKTGSQIRPNQGPTALCKPVSGIGAGCCPRFMGFSPQLAVLAVAGAI